MTPIAGPITEIALSFAVGAASALVPVVNAEAWALVAAGRSGPAAAVVLVVALAAGQTLGKLVLFEASRRGSARWSRLTRKGTQGRAAAWADRLRRSLACRRSGLPVVLAAASIGLPPLAAVSVVAGAAGQRRAEFALACLVGRVLRFGVLAVPVAWALR